MITDPSNRWQRFLLGLHVIAIVSLVPTELQASEISVDTLYVSTVVGQLGGIRISSNVFFTSGSSLTLSGATGNITTASSVTTSGFFGDGSHLTGISPIVLTSTQTFNGAVTFTSSFTIQSHGRQIILSTSSTVNNIAISSTGALSFYPNLHNSSSTSIPNTTITTTQLGTCVTGSTLTIQTSGGRVEAEFSGLIRLAQPAGSSATLVGILQDGQFVRNLSATKPILYGRFGSGNAQNSAGYPINYLFDAPPPGEHSYCLTVAAPDGGDGITIVNDSAVCRNIFFVKEIK